MKPNKRNNILIILSAICLVLAVSITAIAISTRLNKSDDETSTVSQTVSSTESTTKETTESTTESTTQSTTAESTTKKVETTSAALTTTKKANSGSFYSGVKYRSPYAKTADIYKHGRLLMLLNNDWELPEDFKWDLVYWSNGQSVDALSLNYPQYDRVFAVDRAAYQPLKDMFAAAEKAGVPLQMISPYRSIQKQDRLFTESVNSYIKQGYSESEAIKKANYSRTFTGTSEHNTGLGFDILEKGNWTLSQGFEKTAQFKWLMENAEDYGFILRYQKDKVSKTGIMYEPWHFRYVGVENAKAINSKGMCLEEYIAYLDGVS